MTENAMSGQQTMFSMLDFQQEEFESENIWSQKQIWQEHDVLLSDIECMTEIEIKLFINKENLWKEPDYQSLIDNGISTDVVNFMRIVRDSLVDVPQFTCGNADANMRIARTAEFIETVRQLKSVIETIRTVDDAMQAFDRFVVENGYLAKLQVNDNCDNPRYMVTKKGSNNFVITNKLIQTLYITSVSDFEHRYAKQ